MKTFILPTGQSVKIDDEDYAKVASYRWHYIKGYAAVSIYLGGGRANCRRKFLAMHRLIMDAQPGQMVDHRDGDGLNNQRANLRFCSKSENIHNSPKSRGLNPYKGVFQHKSRFEARICVRGDIHYLGMFKTPEEARDAYNAASVKHLGEFSHTFRRQAVAVDL